MSRYSSTRDCIFEILLPPCPEKPGRKTVLIFYFSIFFLALTFGWSKTWAREPFGYENLVVMARDLAAGPFQESGKNIPAFLLALDYDQWRDIRFKPEASVWRSDNLPFEIQFFHPGFFYDRAVTINLIESGQIRPAPFSTDLFNYGANDFKEKIPADLGFAGFRLHYPINRKDIRDEVAVFLGASYFRSLGRNQQYGLSARGLAVDTGLESGEKFPFFRKFWLEKPDPDADKITVYALLDGLNATGAYKFVIHPGKATVMDVKATIFRRKQAGKLGIAPLTSMFFYAENTNQRPADDFRPEVHDSDGLLMGNGSGEFIWRPLVNPGRLFINAFELLNPSGFGLLQRDQDFDHYQDQEARYNMRPSAWVQPIGEWGKGHVELIQIPISQEYNDNIVAFWVPANLPPDNQPLPFAYELRWYAAKDTALHPAGYVVSTRSAAGRQKGVRKLVVDFKGGKLEKLPDMLPADSPMEAVVTVTDGGEIVEKQLYRNKPNNTWRLVFEVARKEEGTMDKILPDVKERPPLELQAYLKQGETLLTETWSYAVWP